MFSPWCCSETETRKNSTRRDIDGKTAVTRRKVERLNLYLLAMKRAQNFGIGFGRAEIATGTSQAR